MKLLVLWSSLGVLNIQGDIDFGGKSDNEPIHSLKHFELSHVTNKVFINYYIVLKFFFPDKFTA